MKTKQAGTESVNPGVKPLKSNENVSRKMPNATECKEFENTAKSFKKWEEGVRPLTHNPYEAIKANAAEPLKPGAKPVTEIINIYPRKTPTSRAAKQGGNSGKMESRVIATASSFTEEQMSNLEKGALKGISEKIKRKMKSGALSPEEAKDLSDKIQKNIKDLKKEKTK